MTKKLVIILLCLCSTIVAQERKIIKSEYGDADGVINTRFFQYDSIGRLLRMDEVGNNGDTIAYDIHSYNGLVDTAICYRTGYFAYAIIITYTDSTYSKEARRYLSGEDGLVEDSVCYQYDTLGRLVRSIWGDNYGTYMTIEYFYKPYKASSIQTTMGTEEKVKTQFEFMDRDCKKDKKSKKVCKDVTHKTQTSYYRDGRIKWWRRYENGKLKEKIGHQYKDNIEKIITLDNFVIMNYY